MSWPLVAHVGTPLAPGGGTSGAINTTGANFLVAAISIDNTSTVATLTDSKGNTWREFDGLGNPNQRIFWASNAIVGASHTVTVTETLGYSGVCFAAFTAPVSTAQDMMDRSARRASPVTSTVVQAGSITPSRNGELIIAVSSLSAIYSSLGIDSGFTVLDEVPFSTGVNYGIGMAYLDQSVAAAVNPTWTRNSSALFNASIISFAPDRTSGIRVTQLAVETLTQPHPGLRFTQLSVEAVTSKAVPLKFTQLSVEALTSQPVPLRFTQLSIETITAARSGNTGAFIGDGGVGGGCWID